MPVLLMELITLLEEYRQETEKFNKANLGRQVREMRVDYLDAVFYAGRSKKPIARMHCIKALDCLMNETYRFEDFDLSEATRVTLESQ